MATHSQKLNRLTVLASTALLLLLGSIGYIQWQDKTQLAQRDAAYQTLLRSLKSIDISRPGVDTIQLRLSGQEWFIQQPCMAQANPLRVEPLSKLLTSSEHTYTALEVDMEAAGLEQPLARLTLNENTIAIGNTDLSGDRRYIRRNDRIEFAPEWILSLIQGGLSAMANLEVFPNGLKSISIQNTEQASDQIAPLDIEEWKSMTANQVIDWPIKDNDDILNATHKLIYDDGLANREVRLLQYQRYSVIVGTNDQCAYIIDNNIMPSW